MVADKNKACQINALEERLNEMNTVNMKNQELVLLAERKLKDALDDAELTSLQLHQVQEELEHYFLLSREQESLILSHESQQKRVEKLLGSIL